MAEPLLSEKQTDENTRKEGKKEKPGRLKKESKRGSNGREEEGKKTLKEECEEESIAVLFFLLCPSLSQFFFHTCRGNLEHSFFPSVVCRRGRIQIATHARAAAG